MSPRTVARRVARMARAAGLSAPAATAALAVFLSAPAVPVRAEEPLLAEITAEAGLQFDHSSGATGDKNYRETMGSGVCLFDADGDGLLDVYVVTCIGPNRLYRNLGGLRFQDVTDASGAGDEGYGMGAVAADVDADGDADLLVTNYGPNRLYRNRGDGTFEDVSEDSGLDHAAWGCGAAFLDADADGDLDVYIANYVDVAHPDTVHCLARDGVTRLVCKPTDYPAAPDVFFRNRGDGTFEDATEEAGLDVTPARGLGVVVLDYDRDGDRDIYVANDLDPNLLYENDGTGRFEEVGFFSGTSHSEGGRAESGMGVAAGDYDNDGWLDLFVTNFVGQTNTLYHNEGDGFFQDETAAAGLGRPSLPYVGWGTAFVDLDGDGWRDLIVANGHVEPDAEMLNDPVGWKQSDLVFRNLGNGRFEDITDGWAPGFRVPEAARGAACGDLDNDGDADVIVLNQDGPLRFYENRSAMTPWIGVDAGTVGARVSVHSGADTFADEVRAGASFLSADDPRCLFRLGERAAVDSVVVEWPGGTREVLASPELNRYHVLRESP